MVTIARETRPVTSHIVDRATQGAPPPPPARSHLNLAPPTTATTSTLYKDGALLGFLGLGILAALFVLVFLRQRELRRLREQIAQALELEATRYSLLARTLIPHTQPIPVPAAPTAQITPQPQPTLATPPIPAPAPADETRAALPNVGRVHQPSAATQPSERTIYHGASRLRRWMLVAGIVVAGGAAFGIYTLRGRVFASSRPLAVAVFNATSTPGAAHSIADQLKVNHVQLGRIGNINANLGTGVYVLYPPGAQAQARRVAKLMLNRSPTVEPIEPDVQNAVGQHNEIVIVID